MHILNTAMLQWRNRVKEILENEGIDYFTFSFKVDNNGVCKCEVWWTAPRSSPYQPFNSSSLEAADPDELIAEIVHRVQFQRRQSAVALPAPETSNAE